MGKLVEELGEGGFMNISDLNHGMTVIITGAENEKYNAVVEKVDETEETVLIKPEAAFKTEWKGRKPFAVQFIVNNSVYQWENALLSVRNADGICTLAVGGTPKVFNRRKHPRLPMANTCLITILSENKSVNGRMVNISAGGYAFSCRGQDFASYIGEDIQIKINNLEILDGVPLTGTVIRCSNDNGNYIVGCRMAEDNVLIKTYVSERM